MTLVDPVRARFAGAAEAARKAVHLYLVGGPVGVFYTLKLARIKRRMALVSEYIYRERELNRTHLAVLNQEFTDLVAEHQRTSVGAAQFWNWCEKKAGVQS